MVDFCRVELGIFKGSKYVKSFVCEIEEFDKLLDFLKGEALKRLMLFEKYKVVNIQNWNKRFPVKRLNYIVVVIDEFAELSNCKDVMKKFKIRIAQDRKVGIHYILSTQRPSVDVIDGTIKNNVPSRIALKVTSVYDSETILNVPGAENLNVKGRALLDNLKEIHVMYLSDEKAIELIS